MRTLHVPLHTFWAQHSAVEWKLFPWLETDHLVVADFQLNAALLTAETTMRLDELLRRMGGLVAPAAGRFILKVRSKAFKGFGLASRRNGHELPLSYAVARFQATCACRRDKGPAMF